MAVHRSWPMRVAALVAAMALVAPPAVLSVVGAADAQASRDARDITTFACPTELESPFTDIDDNVHELAISCAAAYGITTGQTQTTYAPGGLVTRGQMASFLVRAIERATGPLPVEDQGFTDIAGNLHADAINAVAGIGVAKGVTATTFEPAQPVRRDQMASFIGRVLDATGSLPGGPDAFGDDDGNVHEAAIDALAALGVVAGLGDGRYHPTGLVRRDAMASFVARAIDAGIEAGDYPALVELSRALAALTGPDGAQASALVQDIGMPGVLCYDLSIHRVDGEPTDGRIVRSDDAGDTTGDVVVVQLPAHEPDAGGSDTRCIDGVDQSAVDGISAEPERYAVVVATATDGAALRGQLGTAVADLGAEMSGGAEVPGPGDADAFGIANLTTTTQRDSLCLYLEVGGMEPATAAHVHRGTADQAGPVVITLRTPDAGGLAFGCVAGVDGAVLDELEDDPSAFYVNVHNGDFPAGAVRGQLVRLREVSADLDGAQEVPGPGDPDGTGVAFVASVSPSSVCWFVAVEDIDQATAAHIHRGERGVAGPVVVPLEPPGSDGETESCADELDPVLVDDIVSSPELFYVNVHNADHPGGAVRGQLAAPVGDEETAASTAGPKAARRYGG